MDGFAPHELLELVLTYALPRRDTKPLAKELLARFGSLAGVLDARPEELRRTAGVGSRSAELLSLFRPVCAAYLREGLRKKDVLSSPQRAADYCRMRLAGEPHERVHALFLDSRNRVVAEKSLFEGTVDQSAVYPRRLIEEALAAKAVGFILVHNHPSGQVSPSKEDALLTRRVREAARSVDLRFLDHLIVGREGHFSFREAGEL